MRFAPEAEAAEVPNVVVDGSANTSTVLTLSHWPGTDAPASAHADTSAEMVLRYLASGAGLHGAAEVATNNHFDQDGLAGLYALTRPDDALARRRLLVEVARAGDFATYTVREAARASMALAAMAALAPSGPYAEITASLLEEGLGILGELLDHPDRFEHLWKDEDAALAESEDVVATGQVSVREVGDLDIAVVGIDAAAAARLGGGTRFAARQVDGLHPMALHGLTPCSRLLVAHGDVYRVTFRYESWVQYRSRPVPRRVDLAPLAEELTAVDDVTWTTTPVADLIHELFTVDRAPSSLSLADVEAMVMRHLSTAPPAFDPYATPTDPSRPAGASR